MEKVKYNTKQKAIVLEELMKNQGKMYTVKELTTIFKNSDKKIGMTTIYRSLEELEQENKIKTIKENNQKTFGYFKCSVENHYHLKCDTCGQVIHINCSDITKVKNHIEKDHSFNINVENLFLKGTCNKCKL